MNAGWSERRVFNGDQKDGYVAECTWFIPKGSGLSGAEVTKKSHLAHAESHLMSCVNPSISP